MKTPRSSNPKSILSIEGGMAIGKTTLIRKLETMNLGVEILYENIAPVIAKVKELKLDTNILADYQVNQRLFIEDVVAKIEQSKSEVLLMDYGPEAIEFHTLFYPTTQGFDWDIETELKAEMELIRKYRSQKTFFLDADIEILRTRKQADDTRTRSSFEFYIEHMHKKKKEWFAKLNGIEFVNVERLSPNELARMMGEKIACCIHHT